VVTSEVAALSALLPPSIISQPVGTQAVAGTTVTLAAGAAGAEPLSYQWWFGRYQMLAGATNPTLTIRGITPLDAGSYQMVVSNPYGQVTSGVATVSVPTPLELVLPPRSQVLAAGTNIQFYVIVSGQPPLGFQWWFNQTNLLSGETASVLSLANVQTNNEGAYTVVITDGFGASTSAVALLTFGLLNPDSDNDGMPDDWESAHNLVVGVNDAALDPDGDGMSNLQEYLAGTDPHDPASLLKVQAIVAVGANPTLQFLAISNRTYAVEFRSLVATGAWGTLTNLLPEPTNRTVTVTDPEPIVTNRYYRIIIPVP
jgi:hypothetical protein